jgi:uncharacterized protein (TIGR01777 family)
MSARKLVLPGGAGYLGGFVSEYFANIGWEVVVLSRRAGLPPGTLRRVAWDGETLGPWAEELNGADAVINLAGRSVNCRYNARNCREIYDSRLHSTRVLGAAISRCAQPPPAWINSSSATIYRDVRDRPMDEATGELGKGFSVDVCRKWEHTLNEAPTPGTRKVALRTAIVLGPGPGGALEQFVRITRLGLGGTLGPGDQYVSWVHAQDFVRTLAWVIEHEELSGPVNCASPDPIPNRDFMRVLREVCRAPFGLPATAWILEIGAFFLGTETELLLKSRRVVPGRLLASGFTFEHPEVREALESLVPKI